MSDKAWKSWLALVEFETMAARECFRVRDISALDELQMDHHSKFFMVREYEGCEKPKLLMRANYPVDVFHTGPLIRTWCMTFEAHLRILKAIAHNSNYKNVEKRMAHIYAIRCGLMLSDQALSKWSHVTSTVDFALTVQLDGEELSVIDEPHSSLRLNPFQRKV